MKSDRQRRQELHRLKQNDMNQGFKGFGASDKLLSGIVAPYNMNGIAAGEDPLTNAFCLKQEQYVAPGGVFLGGANNVIEERRLFYAFGADSANNATAFEWSSDAKIPTELWMPFHGVIEYLVTQQSPPIQVNPVENLRLPCIMVAYPILNPWVIPHFDTSAGSWDAVPVWANQPVTTFTNNAAGPIGSGFINPVTNLVDNHLGMATMAWLYADLLLATAVTQLLMTYSGKSESHCDFDICQDVASVPWSGTLSSQDKGHGCNSLRMSPKTPLAPGTQIYGIGLYMMSLYDIYVQGITEGITCIESWLISQNVGTGGYVSDYDTLDTTVEARLTNQGTGGNNCWKPYYLEDRDTAGYWYSQKMHIGVNKKATNANESIEGAHNMKLKADYWKG